MNTLIIIDEGDISKELLWKGVRNNRRKRKHPSSPSPSTHTPPSPHQNATRYAIDFLNRFFFLGKGGRGGRGRGGEEKGWRLRGREGKEQG